MIEALDNGALYLIQLGGGCRYGYYAELQEKILKDLGYKFKIYNLVNGKANIFKMYKTIKKIDKKANIFKILHYLLITINMIKYMDKIDNYIRQNIGFVEEKEKLKELNNKMLKEFSKTKNLIHLYKIYKKYNKEIKKINVIKNNPIKVGVIGELYTIMEPFSNYYLEETLASYNIEVKRFTNVMHLLFTNKKKYIKKTNRFLKYKLGADSSCNVYFTSYLCHKKYDGIIHIKSSFCTPEIEVIPIIDKIAHNNDVPIIYFSFNAETSETGIKTRLEAFNDMIEMRKNKI